MPSFSVINGVRAAWSLTGPEGAPVVLLANGLAADSTMWDPQMEAFASTYRLLRYDMRGHGESEGTPGDYSLSLLADDVVALLDALSLERVHLVGCSLGAMVGQFMGVHHSSRLKSLTLCATSSEAPKSTWESRVAAVRKHGVPPQIEATIDRWFTPAFRDAHPETMNRMREMVLRTTQDGYAGCAAAIRDMTLSSIIAAIELPTLVVAGEHDLSTPLPTLERIADTIPGAVLVTVADAAHMPTIEQPEECNRVIMDFLQSVDDGTVRDHTQRIRA
ncbi:3-oxoadipate enol-lactonase [Rhizobium sp. BK313]|uniref:3-oxoadipate enol-lactonase n=1 Tax=Rhizobium sp. BK313 TaxID=2587081 RepID=UPI00105E3F21|nr:3-oxoadipate enol-lactonase [Rhizobium sp. BK313]MBB3458332.1 3-oxoadipate enol-lactonase [Rhizobium sp. BK313]